MRTVGWQRGEVVVRYAASSADRRSRLRHIDHQVTADIRY